MSGVVCRRTDCDSAEDAEGTDRNVFRLLTLLGVHLGLKNRGKSPVVRSPARAHRAHVIEKRLGWCRTGGQNDGWTSASAALQSRVVLVVIVVVLLCVLARIARASPLVTVGSRRTGAAVRRHADAKPPDDRKLARVGQSSTRARADASFTCLPATV